MTLTSDLRETIVMHRMKLIKLFILSSHNLPQMGNFLQVQHQIRDTSNLSSLQVAKEFFMQQEAGSYNLATHTQTNQNHSSVSTGADQQLQSAKAGRGSLKSQRINVHCVCVGMHARTPEGFRAGTHQAGE